MTERLPPSVVRARRDAPPSPHGGHPEPLLPPDELLEEAYPDQEEMAVATTQTTAAWVARLLYFVFGVVEILIGLRVLLKLIAANPGSGFATFIYTATGPFIAPFKNIVNSPTARNGSTLEISSLLAIVIYLLLNWLVVRLFLLLIDRPAGVGPHLRSPR